MDSAALYALLCFNLQTQIFYLKLKYKHYTKAIKNRRQKLFVQRKQYSFSYISRNSEQISYNIV